MDHDRRASQHRSADEALFRELIENASDAIVVVNESGIIRLVNRQVEPLLGWKREELVGRHVETLIPEQARGRHPTFRQRYLQDPEPRPMGAMAQLAALTKDGNEIPVDISLSPMRSGGELLVSAAIRDIRERQRVDALFRGLLEAAPDMIVVVNADGDIQLVNRQVERVLGWDRSELVGQSVETLLPSRFRAGHPALRRGFMESPGVRPMGVARVLEALRRDGSELPVEVYLSPLETDQGTLVIAALRDVTEQRRVRQEIRELNESLERRVMDRAEELAASERRFRAAFESAPIGEALIALSLNKEPFIRDVNHAFETLIGADRRECVDRSLLELVHADDRAAVEQALAADPELSKPLRLDCRIGTIGVQRWARLTISRFDDAESDGLLQVEDVTAQVAAEEQLRYQALHDPLTGLANRTLIRDRIRQALRESGERPVAVLYVDLDGFKDVNDQYGHTAGDDVLVSVARALEGAIRPGDTLGRLGGDEFVVVCPALFDPADAAPIAQRLVAAVERTRATPSNDEEPPEIAVTASVGAYVATTNHSDPDQLLDQADTALYAAKQAGGGRYHVNQNGLPEPRQGDETSPKPEQPR
ncbi:MAG: PAS domain S-box protein [Actinobacteria bacterium]|nr:PAS domain S-box protein [Actinomycetota bacterium]